MKNCTLTETKELLAEISDMNLDLEKGEKLDIVKDLQSTPRSGIDERVKKYHLQVPIQSIYDHILQLAYNYDVLATDLELNDNQDIMAQIIVFHDLSESILGDIPDYTKQNEKYLRDGEIDEEVAEEIISHHLPKTLARRYLKVVSEIKELKTELSKTFHFIDKTEPIITIWRYLYQFRDQIKIHEFIQAMTDFFDNPVVRKSSLNKKTDRMITFLQNKQNAKDYHQNTLEANSIPFDLKRIIENREIKTVE